MDVSQEIMTLGFCNFIGSFFGSLSITGSIDQSRINSVSGVQTPFGGCVTGLIVIAGTNIAYRVTIKERPPKNLVVAIIGAMNRNLFASAIVPYVYRNANIQ